MIIEMCVSSKSFKYHRCRIVRSDSLFISTQLVSEFKTAWLGLANSKEQYVLKYESKYLIQLGKALDYLVSIAINAATQEALKYTVLSG